MDINIELKSQKYTKYKILITNKQKSLKNFVY